MIKLFFYYGPGDMATKAIRFLTRGPYSHVELQFTDGCRLFSSGHGIYKGVHTICDRKSYDHYWDQIIIPATQEQEKGAEQFILQLIGVPFDWLGMTSFLVPLLGRSRKANNCSSLVLQVLQDSLHMFPGIPLKISPNGLHKLLTSEHALVVSTSGSDDPQKFDDGPESIASSFQSHSRAVEIRKGFPVVCLAGASSAPDPFIELIRHLRPDLGVAIIVINHLRTIATLLHEILPRYTKMPVELITDGLLIQPNRVFILQAERDLHVRDGKFRLKKVSKPTGWPDVITVFLRSLALHWHGQLVAVILSGYDGDGAGALRAVKDVGGVTMAQQVETAAQPDMPLSAIASGCIDFILSVENMSKEIERIAVSRNIIVNPESLTKQ
jgi:two-component system chemotaxis response regulator CheB